eukprot:TCALIF_07755-PA protein Name:"Protein of unknown function" AED:0.00 eAED:0.00 QI:74/1/0.66/1/0.5/0.66/3/0/591
MTSEGKYFSSNSVELCGVILIIFGSISTLEAESVNLLDLLEQEHHQPAIFARDQVFRSLDSSIGISNASQNNIGIPRICRCQRDRPLEPKLESPGKGFANGRGNLDEAPLTSNLERNQHLQDWIEDAQMAEEKRPFQQDQKVESQGGSLGFPGGQSVGTLDHEHIEGRDRIRGSMDQGTIIGTVPNGRAPKAVSFPKVRPQIYEYGSSWGVRPPKEGKDQQQQLPSGPIFEDIPPPRLAPEGERPRHDLGPKGQNLKAPKEHRVPTEYQVPPNGDLEMIRPGFAQPEEVPTVWRPSRPGQHQRRDQVFDRPTNPPPSQGGSSGGFQPDRPKQVENPNFRPLGPDPYLNAGWHNAQPRVSPGFEPGEIGVLEAKNQPREDPINLKRRASRGHGSQFKWDEDDSISGEFKRFGGSSEEVSRDRQDTFSKANEESERQMRLKQLRRERRREAELGRQGVRKSRRRKSSKSSANQSSSRKDQFHATIGHSNGISFESNVEHHRQESAFASEQEEESEYISVYEDEILDRGRGRGVNPSRRDPFKPRQRPVEVRRPPKHLQTIRKPPKPRSGRRPINVPIKRPRLRRPPVPKRQLQ